MRILFITRKYPPSVGGMETYSKEIHRAFKSIGSHVDLHVPPADVLGRPTLRQMASFFLSTCWMLLHRARDYDAILLGDFALASIAPVAKLATLGRTRVVVTMHGNDLYFMRKRTPLAIAYWLLNRCIIATRTLDAAIANSQAIREEAARYGVLDVTVVPLATVVPPRQVMDAVGRKPRIIFTGRLIHYKGLSWFVREVWPHLSSTLELVVAGQVWDAAEMDCIANQAGIRYLGALSYDDLAPLRAGSIASIMPNIPPDRTEQDEGFGLVALEAPAVGTPTVASRCGGIPDAVADGITGFLVPALDAGAWIRRLDEIATWQPLQRQAFAERARQHVIEHYNWTLVAERTLAVLGPPSSNPATVDSFHQ